MGMIILLLLINWAKLGKQSGVGCGPGVISYALSE